ncbi:MAG: Ros/MucR family transcriptional regulator [Caulobacteraceae bacterium]
MSDNTETVALATDIVSAFVSNNKVAAGDLPDMIAQVFKALDDVAKGAKPQEPAVAPTPAVSIKKSITPDHLISLEDGQKYKSLKRHLSTRGMTPEDYRAKWGLPRDYPMVAANYSAQRSQLAKALGLGQGGRGAIAAPEPEPTPAPVAEPAPVPARRSRSKAT